ncbi:hypothetical protein A1Q2_06515 [Trichosporon asahii var. asahii CBS 8904]|uniref:Uncharacterized protein n=1 Tax=Trichosporon asahii var. asahii (strain CBS 8904) TaxID=1220162 RepID=K1VJ19_TRIAC|nr:hypothetical protein A1Q2_06515 [Trichosporon asahii var. asahii CBS 8904]
MPPKGSPPAGRTDAVTIALVLQPGAEVIFGPLIELNLICKLGCTLETGRTIPPSPLRTFEIAELGRYAAAYFTHTIVEVKEEAKAGVASERHEDAAQEGSAGGSRSESLASRKDSPREVKVNPSAAAGF